MINYNKYNDTLRKKIIKKIQKAVHHWPLNGYILQQPTHNGINDYDDYTVVGTGGSLWIDACDTIDVSFYFFFFLRINF